MLSPFPGMDLYLEDPLLWPDFHQGLATEIRRQLTPLLRPRYFAALEPRVVYMRLDADELCAMFPDVGVMEPPSSLDFLREASVSYMPIPPAPLEKTLTLEVPVTSPTIVIHDRRNNELVATIEILSPANKRPGSRALRQYHRKRRNVLHGEVHLLEIDLLRGGERPPLPQPLPDAPYFVVLARVERRPVVEVWPIELREALPTLPVPLCKPDPDVPLELGRAVAAVYEDGAYDLRVDYGESPPEPPLPDEAAAWVESLLCKIRSDSQDHKGNSQ